MKKKPIIIFLMIVFFVNSFLFAGRREGVEATKEKMEDIISQAANAEAVPVNNQKYVNNYKTLSSINVKLTDDYYNKTSISDYTKAKTMDMLGQLAITSAFAIGTADQNKQTALISEQAEALSASKDPEYQAIGNKYTQLAAALKSGNEIEAQSIAASIQEYTNNNAPGIDPGYKPSKEENSLLAGLGSVLSGSLGRIGSMLTSFGLTKLLTMLGGAALAANPLTMAIGIILGDTIGAVASSVTNGGVVNWEPVENSTINQTASGVGGATNNLQGALNKDLAQTTPWALNTNTDAVVEGSKEHGGTKAPE